MTASALNTARTSADAPSPPAIEATDDERLAAAARVASAALAAEPDAVAFNVGAFFAHWRTAHAVCDAIDNSTGTPDEVADAAMEAEEVLIDEALRAPATPKTLALKLAVFCHFWALEKWADIDAYLDDPLCDRGIAGNAARSFALGLATMIRKEGVDPASVLRELAGS
jgi:hypothetical protein